MTVILGLKLSNRVNTATEFQKILSKYGCSIRTRVGLHNIDGKVCSPDGIILLEIIDKIEASKLSNELISIDDIEIQQMIFD